VDFTIGDGRAKSRPDFRQRNHQQRSDSTTRRMMNRTELISVSLDVRCAVLVRSSSTERDSDT